MRLFKALSPPWDEIGKWLAILLRLSVLVNRSRALTQIPTLELSIHRSQIILSFPKGWLDQHPLTIADLEEESEYLAAVGLILAFK